MIAEVTRTIEYLGVYMVIISAVALLERRWPAGPPATANGILFNLGLAAISAITTTELLHLGIIANSVFGSIPYRNIIIPAWTPSDFLEWVVGSLVFAFVWDFWQYWYHRGLHTFPLLWRIHALHHDSEALNSSDALRNTFINQVVQTFAIGLPLSVFGGGTLVHTYAGFVLFNVFGFYNHANVRWSHGRLSWLISGPQVHRIHHAFDDRYHNRNYAAFFPIIDIVFGTYFAPQKDEFPVVGLSDRKQSSGGLLSLVQASFGLRRRSWRGHEDLSGPRAGPLPTDPVE